jgi:hypothetical protein
MSAGGAVQNLLPLPPPKKKWKFLQVQRGYCHLAWLFCALSFSRQIVARFINQSLLVKRHSAWFRCCSPQKYWHRGAFFQGEGEEEESVLGDIMHRDYNAPTGEDKFDKEMLPKIMQASVFGEHAASFSSLVVEHECSSTVHNSRHCSPDRNRCETLGVAGAPSGHISWRKTPALRLRKNCPGARQGMCRCRSLASHDS